MALGETVQRLAGDELLRHLPLELDAVSTVLGAFILRRPGIPGQFTALNLSGGRGALQIHSKVLEI
jgi:hypothetical protein